VLGRIRLCVAAACVVAGLAATTAPAGAGGGWYDWPGMKKCQEFGAGSLRIKAYASRQTQTQDRLSCRKANGIMRAWWRGPASQVHEHPDGDVTLERFPGWRCSSGSGGGSCARDDRIAGYQNR
jgi:hypothetical protein